MSEFNKWKPRPGFKPNSRNLREAYEEMLEHLAMPAPSIRLGRGWGSFDKMTGGFRTKEFSILCGPTGCGKTTLLSNWSAQLLRAGEKHFVMSVETGATDFLARVTSVLAERDLNTGEAVPTDLLAKVTSENLRELQSGNLELALYEDRVPVEQLCQEIYFHRYDRGCRIVFIDNLNFFLEVTKSADQIVEMDRVVHELIIFCKQVDVHIVMVMHPRKTEHGRVLSEFEIKGSSTAVQEAHNIFLFNPPHPQDVQSGDREFTDRDLTIRKMRRRGKFVGRTLRLSINETKYEEVKIV